MASHIYKLGVHKLKDVETWANYFENTPRYMKWTPIKTLKAVTWMFLVPYATYKVAYPFWV